MAKSRATIVFVHSSNEMYGADRILLQVLDTLPEAERRAAIVWLPDDVSSATFSLDAELRLRGIEFEIRQLPTLRRKYISFLYFFPIFLSDISFRYIPRTLIAMVRSARDLRRVAPQVVYLTTSASLGMGFLARFLGIKRVILHCQEIWRGPEAYLLGVLAMAATDCLCISEATQLSLIGPGKTEQE